MMRGAWCFLFLVLWASRVFAQPTTVDLEAISPVPTGEWDFEGGKFHFPEVAFASLPAAGTSGRIYVVTNSTSCTSGTGSGRVLCRDTGAAWESLGAGSGGGASNSFETWNVPSGTDPVADSATDTINWTCMAPMSCTGDSSTDTVTIALGPTTTPGASPTPTPFVCPTDALGRGGLIGEYGGKCGVAIATASPTPTATASPTVTVTPTAVACAANFVDAVIGPGSDAAATCVPIRTPPAVYATPTAVVSATPTAVVCPTDASGHLGGLYADNPLACKALVATVTPYPTPTAYPFTVQEEDVTVSSAASTLDFDGDYFDLTESPTGELNITVSSSVMLVSSTVQASQLNRLAGDDQKRYFGTGDDMYLQYASSPNALHVAGSGMVIVGPTPTSMGLTPTPTATVTATRTAVPTVTGGVATPTPTVTATTGTPTPTVTPTPLHQVNGGLEINGKMFGPDDGSLAFPLTSYWLPSSFVFTTTAKYNAPGTNAANDFEDTIAYAVPHPLKCDRISVCMNVQNTLEEQVRFTLRTGPHSENLGAAMANTELSCVVDGNSKTVLNGCNSAVNTSGKRGCFRKLETPLRIPYRYSWSLSGVCAGANCSATAGAAIVTLWCWPDNR